MANTSSAKKATRASARRAEVNKNRTSRIRTHVRKVEEAIVAGVKVDAVAALAVAAPEVMRGRLSLRGDPVKTPHVKTTTVWIINSVLSRLDSTGPDP